MTTQEIKKRIIGKTIRYTEKQRYNASVPDKVLDIHVSRLEFKPNYVWVSIPMKGSEGVDIRLCSLSREVINNLAERGESTHEGNTLIVELKLIDKKEENQ